MNRTDQNHLVNVGMLSNPHGSFAALQAELSGVVGEMSESPEEIHRKYMELTAGSAAVGDTVAVHPIEPDWEARIDSELERNPRAADEANARVRRELGINENNEIVVPRNQSELRNMEAVLDRTKVSLGEMSSAELVQRQAERQAQLNNQAAYQAHLKQTRQEADSVFSTPTKKRPGRRSRKSTRTSDGAHTAFGRAA